jgi:hypothetical protein
MDNLIKVIFNERVQSIIPILQLLPFDGIGISSVNQLVVCAIGPKLGLSVKVIAIILLFL